MFPDQTNPNAKIYICIILPADILYKQLYLQYQLLWLDCKLIMAKGGVEHSEISETKIASSRPQLFFFGFVFETKTQPFFTLVS